MRPLNDLAHAIDSASDEGDETSLRQLGEECENRLDSAEGQDRVLLRYYQANTYSAICAAKRHDADYTWNWEQPDGVQDVLMLRRALTEPNFETIHPIIACQIRTNLANRLNTLGRPVAANEQWLKVLKTEPRFAKALASQGQRDSVLCKHALRPRSHISARYRLYRATHEDDPDFLMRNVLMLDSGEGQALGHYTEDLRSAFRSAYAVFDKIGLFLNDYFQIGIEPKKVTFRGVWSEKLNSQVFKIRPMFKGHPNWPLRGLYFLSKDLFDNAFKEVSAPDTANLARLRQQVEHRFLSIQHFQYGESTETHGLMSKASSRCTASET